MAQISSNVCRKWAKLFGRNGHGTAGLAGICGGGPRLLSARPMADLKEIATPESIHYLPTWESPLPTSELDSRPSLIDFSPCRFQLSWRLLTAFTIRASRAIGSTAFGTQCPSIPYLFISKPNLCWSRMPKCFAGSTHTVRRARRSNEKMIEKHAIRDFAMTRIPFKMCLCCQNLCRLIRWPLLCLAMLLQSVYSVKVSCSDLLEYCGVLVAHLTPALSSIPSFA
ncbi:hypothetical protein B0H11DRAFT_2182470, partial [Mycena galericulata]